MRDVAGRPLHAWHTDLPVRATYGNSSGGINLNGSLNIAIKGQTLYHSVTVLLTPASFPE